MMIRRLALAGALMTVAATGVFAVEITYPSGVRQTIGSASDPVALASSDLDSDGDLDLVVGFGYGVAWWENAGGDGSAWIEHTIDDTIHHVTGVAAADFDLDGDIDTLASVSFEGEVRWFENLGGGAVWVAHTIATGIAGASSVSASDLDGDGDIDAVATSFDGDTVGWWSNDDGLGLSWTAHAIDASFDGARGGHVADIDGDGDLDVAAAAFYDTQIAWWENTDGAGSAWTEHLVATGLNGVQEIAAGDIDRDGDLDLAGTTFFDDSVRWWENTDGSGSSWSVHTISSTLTRPRSVTMADIDQDGLLDAVTTGYVGQIVRVYFNGNDGQSWSAHTFDDVFEGAEQVIAADLDGDGDLDLSACGRNGQTVAWWPNETNHRSALFPEKRSATTGFSQPWSVDTADFDGDGDPDLVAAASGSDTVEWFENSIFEGRDDAWVGTVIDSDFDSVAAVRVADIDGDGDPDVVGAAMNEDAVTWWENSAGNGTTWLERPIAINFDGAFGIDVTDMDADGDLDVVGAALFADTVMWWENTAGDGTAWTARTVEAVLDGAVSVATADLDGDGDVDIATAGSQSDTFEWFENLDGSATSWARHAIASNFDYAHAVAVGDLDGDGDPDLVGASAWSDDLLWWENASGDATVWSVNTIDGAVDGVRGLDLADLDGDGDLDVLAAAAFTSTLSWWEHPDDLATAWTEHQLDGVFAGGTAVKAADLTGDGWLDVVATPFDGDAVEWWENFGGQFALATDERAPTFARSGEMATMFAITADHRGRSEDGDAMLWTIQIQLADASQGTPLTEAEANALVAELTVWLDDGSGVFEPGADTLVVTVDYLSFANSQLTIDFLIGNPAGRFELGTPKNYWVVVELAPDAHLQTPHQLALKHCTRTEYTSSARHWDHSVSLELEWVENLWTGTMVIVDPSTIFIDSFETGDTTAWSRTVL